MKTIIIIISSATIVLNFMMSLLLLNVGGEFRRSVRSSIIAALLANLWAVGALILMIYPIDSAFGLGRTLFLISPMFIMYALILFASEYPFGGTVITTSQRNRISVLSLMSVLIAFVAQDILIPASHVAADGLYIISVSPPAYVLYAVYFGIFSWLYSLIFLGKIKRTPTERKTQAQLAYMGTLVSSFAAFVTNLILPLFSITALIWIGPASSFVYAISFLYGIRRYRLFELRRFAARGMVYVGVLSIVVAIYVLIVSSVRTYFEQISESTINTDVLYGALTLLAMVTYTPLRRYFDSVTKRFFFKNDYEIQDVIDSLGDILLRTKNTKEISLAVSRLLRGVLLTNEIRIFGDELNDTTHHLRKIFSNHRRTTISLDNDVIDATTAVWLRANGFEAVISVKLQSKILAWIVLGPKRSGDAYQKKDMLMLDIASDEIAIAMENARQYEQIELFNETLQTKVKDATRELRDTNKKLREIDASKDEFISMASHQLRTPLTSIKGYISMLLDGDLGELQTQQKKALEEAYDSSQRMVYLIGDFLNLSRIQTGRFELERSGVSLPALIAEEIEQLQQSAKTRNVELLYTPPTTFPTVMLDETKIRQVMMNFIDNAIYYAKPEGGEVLIVLEQQRDHIVFAVKDNGIGVPVSARKHLFSKFFRADNAKKARPDGTGIGLYMAKRVVVAHGGTIIFASVNGKGSEFGFRLPTQNPDA